jgi:putative ABC transport system permease protein
MRSVVDDLRSAMRLLAAKPGFAAASILTLVIGILINVAAFGVVNALWFGKLPFRDDRQVVLFLSRHAARGLTAPMSYADYRDLTSRSRSFTGLAAFAEHSYTLSLALPGAGAERVRGGAMSSSTLNVLGFSPLLGRGFLREEDGSFDQAAGPRSVLIGEGLWRNRFAGSPEVLGKRVRIDGRPAIIVGVLPRSFRFVFGSYQILTPLSRQMTESPRSERSFQVLGRLRKDASIAGAQAELDGLTSRLAAQYPDSNDGWRVSAAPYREAVFGEAMRMYPVLLGAAILVLLIVCANVSNIVLARTAARSREFAVRVSLGASRARILRQLLTEGVVLAGLGAAISILAAYWMSRLLIAAYPDLEAFRLDYRVCAYTVLVSFLAGVAAALGPALASSRVDLSSALKGAGRGERPGRARLRDAMVVSQIAFALTLLAGTGLLVENLVKLNSVDYGVDIRNVYASRISLDSPAYAEPPRRHAFWRNVVERLRRMPGVENASVGSQTPLIGDAAPTRIEVEGRPPARRGDYLRIVVSVAGDRYFDTLAVPILAGRTLAAADGPHTPAVAVVNRSLAARLWPEKPTDAVGSRIRVGDGTEWTTIVGIVRDYRQNLMSEPFAEVFLPAAQNPMPDLAVLVKAPAIDRATLSGWIRREVNAVDPDLPAGELLGERDLIEMFYPRVMISGLGAVTTFASLLTAVGLFGVVSFLVYRRTHEFGIRLSLGASPQSITRLVLLRGLRLVFVGLIIGLWGAMALTRVLSSMIFGLSAATPVVFAGAAAMLTAVALAAMVLPAWRAARIDPASALRCE